MNILLLTSTFPSNKDDVMQHPFQLDFIDMLKEGSHNCTILTHARGELHEKIREDLDVIWFPWRRVEGRLVDIDFFRGSNLIALFSLIFNGVKSARRIISQKKIDMVICFWILPSGLYVYVNSLLRVVSVPYILWALGSDINKYRHNFFMRLLLKNVIRGSAYVFADGFELRDTVRELSGKNCEFLPTFRKLAGNAFELNKNVGDCVSFLYVGRHAKVKGIDLLIDAIIKLESSRPRLNYRVTICGDGELTAEMMNRAAANGLDNKVTFAGKVAADDLMRLYSQSDCVVIPSRSESIPLVFSEAVQLNRPMIVADVGDMGTLGRQYGVARIVEKENAAALANAMRGFIEKPFHLDPKLRAQLLSLLMMENSAQKILGIISSLESK